MDWRPELEESLTSFFLSSWTFSAPSWLSPWGFHTSKTTSLRCHLKSEKFPFIYCWFPIKLPTLTLTFEFRYLCHHVVNILVAWLQKVIPQIHLRAKLYVSANKILISPCYLFLWSHRHNCPGKTGVRPHPSPEMWPPLWNLPITDRGGESRVSYLTNPAALPFFVVGGAFFAKQDTFWSFTEKELFII